MAVYIGTSGWAYKEWKPALYPMELPQSRWLEHYSGVFNSCEINATFYRIQEEKTFARWADQTPASFRFAAKAHRMTTHTANIVPSEPQREWFKSFFESLIPLRPKLGAVLFQFAPHRQRDDAALDDFMEILPPGFPFAIEFRNDSWNDASIEEQVARGGGTVCVSEASGAGPRSLPPGPLSYVRLRGERYEPESRSAWRDALGQESERRDVYLFTKHKGANAGDDGAGIGLAQWLTRT